MLLPLSINLLEKVYVHLLALYWFINIILNFVGQVKLTGHVGPTYKQETLAFKDGNLTIGPYYYHYHYYFAVPKQLIITSL